MAKKLMINCASCDIRQVQEENYSHYENITINASIVLTSPRGKAFINNLPVTLNCSAVQEVDDDVAVRTINGSGEIKSSDIVPTSRYFMLVNGSLNIGPGTQRHLEQCAGMVINGLLTCPESILANFDRVKVNGSTICYPDEAILLKHNAVIDKLFALRAKKGLYWSDKRIIITDSELDSELLRSKGAMFTCEEAIIAQSKVESTVDLIDEKAEIIIVPDGTTVITDDITLDSTTLSLYGKKLYVIGNVTVPDKENGMDTIEYLTIRGNAKVPMQQKETFLKAVTEISGKIKFVMSNIITIEDKPCFEITKWMLEQQFTEICDCALVKIANDIPKTLITERLKIEDCAAVKCSEEQKDAVAMICEDVAHIETGNEKENAMIGNVIEAVVGNLKNSLDTKVINAANYIM